MELNSVQKFLINSDAKWTDVVANPGSGKTEVIAKRIGRLMSTGVDGKTIWCFSHSRSAASTLEMRLLTQLGSARASQVTVTTFHAFSLAFIRANGGLNLQVASEQFMDVLVKKMAGEVYKNGARKPSVSAIRKDLDAASGSGKCLDNKIETINKKVQQFMGTHKLIDFNGILRKCIDILSRNDATVDCAHLIVDEYQDLSEMQVDILAGIVKRCKPVMFTVGDSDQKIYDFSASASVKLTEKLTPQFAPVIHTVQMNVNYRCNEHIVAMSQRIIYKDTTRRWQFSFVGGLPW